MNAFKASFTRLLHDRYVSKESKTLTVGARVGNEIQALLDLGIKDSIGIDIVPHPPLVIEGDMHDMPFEKNSFDFIFSNIIDHSKYPQKFANEVNRVLKPGGTACLHIDLKNQQIHIR